MLQPIIPTTGIAGWRFLERTYDRQLETFSASPSLERETQYFLDNIGKVTSAEELVSDPQLLRVALGAFGLESDIQNKYFIQRVLADGTSADDALANRLSDERYKKFSDAFDLGPGAFRNTAYPSEMQKIADLYQAQSFETSVGEIDNDMRLALYLQRELPELAASSSSTDTKWFTVMGNPPLRQVFETALGLPKSVGQLDIDQQLGIFKDRAEQVFGSDGFDQFMTEQGADDLTTKFLARAQLAQITSALSPASTALVLLQNI